MKKITKLSSICVAAALTVGIAWTQAEKPVEQAGNYRLDFVVKELEGGKTINSRAYSMTIIAGKSAPTSIRTGSKVPVEAKDGSISYIELGVNLDCRLAKQTGNELSLNMLADISSVAEHSGNPPVIRNTRWGGDVVVPLRKPTGIFSSDDAMSKRQMQLELTATPIQ